MLLSMVELAQAHRAPIVRLLADASAAPHANVRDLDRPTATAVEAALMRPHEVTVRLGAPPACPLGCLGDATRKHQARSIHCDSCSTVAGAVSRLLLQRRWASFRL